MKISGLQKVLLLVAALLLVIMAVGGTLMVIDKEHSEVVVEEAVVEYQAPIYVDLKPAFTVNLDPEDAVRFLQVSIQALTYVDGVAEDIRAHQPQIRNHLLLLLSQQKSTALRSAEGKTQLQKQILETIQKVIDTQGRGGVVDSVYFTNFVMQ